MPDYKEEKRKLVRDMSKNSTEAALKYLRLLCINGRDDYLKDEKTYKKISKSILQEHAMQSEKGRARIAKAEAEIRKIDPTYVPGTLLNNFKPSAKSRLESLKEASYEDIYLSGDPKYTIESPLNAIDAKGNPEIEKIRNDLAFDLVVLADQVSGTKNLKKDIKVVFDKFAKLKDPFYKLAQISEAIQNEIYYHPDNVDAQHPEEYIGKFLDEAPFPIEDKITYLAFIGEDMQNHTLPMNVQLKGEEAFARNKKVGDYMQKYAIGKAEETVGVDSGNKMIQVNDDAYKYNIDTCGVMVNAFSVPFLNSKPDLQVSSMGNSVINFCRKKILEYNEMLLDNTYKEKGQTYEDSNLFLKGVSGLKEQRDKYQEIIAAEKAAAAFTGPGSNGEKGVGDKLRSSSLWFRGSDKYENVMNGYSDLVKLLNEHKSNPTPESFKKLSEQSKALSTYAEDYVSEKYRQLGNKEIEGTVIKKNGGGEYTFKKESTRNRVNAVKDLQKQLMQLDKYIADGIAKKDGPKKEAPKPEKTAQAPMVM